MADHRCFCRCIPSFSVALDASSSIRTLTLQGPFQTCQIIRREDNALVISTSEFFKTAGRLDINAYEFESVKVEGSDVTIRFSEARHISSKSNRREKWCSALRPQSPELM